MTDSKDFAACSAAQLFQIYTKTDEILDPDKKVLHQYFKSAILHALHDEAAKEALSDNVISTLSSLICGGGNPVTDLPRLKKELGAGGPCGKILQCNDPTFCCLDCALDKTCVMCMECYNASPHAAEKHNLHVNTSRGHGMCDCGDEEAWKYGATCTTHQGRESDDDTPVDMKLPVKIRHIATILFDEILKLAMGSFFEHGEKIVELQGLPSSILPDENDCVDVTDRYASVIYNDEVHNFDEVIAQFKQLLFSSHSEASTHATSIDREGRKLIKVGTKAECLELTDKFLNYKPQERSRTTKKPLVTKLISEYFFLLQNLLTDVVDWMSVLSRDNLAFKRILCQVSMKKDEKDACLVEKMMLEEVFFWKKVKSALHNLFMSTYFGDVLYKKEVGVLFVKNYGKMLQLFLDDEKGREFNFSIISLTVQLFTVPSISVILLTDHDALSTIFQQFSLFYYSFVIRRNNYEKFFGLKQSNTFKRHRITHTLLDLKYLLSNIPDEITTATEDAFLKFLESYATFISYMQEMNPHVRESANHILHEKEWNPYFTMEVYDIKLIMASVSRWCISSPRLFVKSLQILINAQHKNSEKYELSEPGPVTMSEAVESMFRALPVDSGTEEWVRDLFQLKRHTMFEKQMSYIQHDMLKDPVSFHIPLTRLFASVFSFFHKFDLSIDLFLKAWPFVPEELLDIPLRSIILNQQVEASMWKRNGTGMENQSSCYRDLYKFSMWDMDLLAVQLILSMSDPEDAMFKIVQKYKIEPYLYITKCKKSFDPLLRMAEAFSALLLYVLGERFRLNVSEATEEDVLRKDAIHILAIQNIPRSVIVKNLMPNFGILEDESMKVDALDEIIAEIADKTADDDGIKTILSLKSRLYNEFTPFYYHYSHGQRQSAENIYYKKMLKQEMEFKPPPLPKFTRLTKKLRHYFVLPVVQRFIYVAIKRFFEETGSDLLLHQVLYFVMFGVLDEFTTQDDPLPTKFTSCLTRPENPGYLILETDQTSIVALLKQLLNEEVKSVEEVKPLIRWIIKTCDLLTNTDSLAEDPDQETQKMSISPVNSHKEMMRKRREQIMNSFKNQMVDFRTEYSTAFEKLSDDETMVEEVMESEDGTEHVVCGPKKGPIPRPETMVLTCILCKDSDKVSEGFSTMMYGCLIEKSVVLKLEKLEGLADEKRLSHLLAGEDVHIQSCGHPMHLKCLKQTPTHRFTFPGDDRGYLYLHRGEFSCPYCKTVANCVLPVVGYASSTCPDVGSEVFLGDVARRMDEDSDIYEMDIEEFPESPPSNSPPAHRILPRLQFGTGGQQLLELLRDHQVLYQHINRINDEGPEDTEGSEEITPAGKFKEDMKRFYRRARNLINKESLGSRCYAPITLKMVSYTFSMLEYNFRDKPLLAGLAEYQEGFFEAFLHSLHQSMTINDHLYNQELTREVLDLFAPQITRTNSTPSLLNTEIFTVFVAARFTIYDPSRSYDEALVELCVTGQVMKILLSVSGDEISGAEAGADDADAIQLATVWGHVRKMCGFCDSDAPFQAPTYLLSTVKQQLLPMLRKMALFLRYMTLIPGCPALSEIQSPEGEFTLLMQYLNIPSLSSILVIEGGLKSEVVQKWCKTINKVKFNDAVLFNKTKREASFVDLPHSFVDLLCEAAKYTCPKINFGKIQTTAICLICGDMVCFQSYCCQETIDDTNFGPSNVHAHRCSGDLGVFLTLDKCQVLFLPLRTTGILLHGPYVDKYGENYKSAKNKALHFAPQIYKKLEKMWVKHEIRPMVARNSDLIGFTGRESLGYLY